MYLIIKIASIGTKSPKRVTNLFQLIINFTDRAFLIRVQSPNHTLQQPPSINLKIEVAQNFETIDSEQSYFCIKSFTGPFKPDGLTIQSEAVKSPAGPRFSLLRAGKFTL